MDYADAFRLNYSTAIIADAAFRAGVPVRLAPVEVKPLRGDWKVAGPVKTVVVNNDLVSVVAQVHRAALGDVICLRNPATVVGVLGDLVASEAKRKQLGGFVVDGWVRDRADLEKIGVPVFARGCVPVGPLKLKPEQKGIGTLDEPIPFGEGDVSASDWVFGDADGVLFLPADALADVFAQAYDVQQREARLTDALHRGEALGDLLGIEAFLQARAADPDANFNDHLKRTGRAI